jgi:hypothetical protein
MPQLSYMRIGWRMCVGILCTRAAGFVGIYTLTAIIMTVLKWTRQLLIS